MELTTAMLVGAAREAGIFVSADGRVSEACCARLLGISAGYFKQLRQANLGPPAYRTAVAGSRYSYRLSDVALWIELTRQPTAVVGMDFPSRGGA